ncbi:Transcriptional regulator putative LuxR family [Sodalis praecaptivus]|uniref:Transcriptional regulator putative LuxR family n=3 Tax=Bruguierivoracaceae TaxID=2812006 RepID=W0HN74_9GAMM|nr:Transcriptional regulator putative LuxR family [Sodalis praecaptivus]
MFLQVIILYASHFNTFLFKLHEEINIMGNRKNHLKSYLKSPQSLISFIKNSSDHWLIKDNEAKYVFVNDSATEFFRFPKKFNAEGRTDKEVPTDICQELWPEFIASDEKVIKENRKIISIAIHHYGKGNTTTLVPHYAERAPLYDDDNKLIGIVTHGRRLDVPELLYYMNRLNKKTIQIDADNELFTKRELEIIFWAQQRLSAKEIAKRLAISYKTVEVHLMNIYNKAGVHSLVQLIEYCRHTGLDKYIPLDFIRKGVQLID